MTGLRSSQDGILALSPEEIVRHVVLRCLGLGLLVSALLAPVAVQTGGPPTRETAADPGLVVVGQVPGKLVKRFPNRKELDELKQNLEAAREAKDFQGLRGIFERFKHAQNEAFALQVPGRLLPVPLELAGNVEVRLQEPPTQFDTKGNIVKPTPELLKKLKGPDPKKPGYLGARTDLHEGQVVVVGAGPGAGQAAAEEQSSARHPPSRRPHSSG
jgi:hypothetical protein